jgi:hypothetical protein
MYPSGYLHAFCSLVAISGATLLQQAVLGVRLHAPMVGLKQVSLLITTSCCSSQSSFTGAPVEKQIM